MAVQARVAVVTGASSGIGKEAAKALAAQGWRVIAVGRDPGRAEAALAEIRVAATGPAPEMLLADLAILAQAARLADEIAAKTDRIDVLLNNAGGVAAERKVTPEGNEATFAGNHLGPFVLTNKLLPLLKAAAEGAPAGAVRIINTSSSGHLQSQGFDWADPQMLEGYSSAGAYCNAKLANILHIKGLAKRLAGTGIVAHAMHPGIVDSNFIATAEPGMQAYFKTRDLISPAEAADTLVWLASAEAPGGSSGGYFHQRQEAETSAIAQDEALAEKLWTESEKMAQKAGF